MRFLRMVLIGAAAAVAFCAGVACADGLQRGGNISCQGPFLAKDTRQSVKARYKSQARDSTLTGLHDEPIDGLLLFPDDISARLEVEEAIGTAGRVTSINLREKNSRWTIEGLSIGMTVQQLAAANGGRFSLSGFRQMSGNIFATLAWLPRGDCEVLVVFKAPKGVRFNHSTDETEIGSDDPRLAPLDLRIGELILSLPEQSIN